MYGKIFEDIFHSTLMNCGGDTAYVFIAMIVLSDEDGILKCTADSLARLICKDAEVVKGAIHHLEQPDPLSNLKGRDGCRIVPLHLIRSDETRGWLVVNKSHYRDKASKSDRVGYMRDYMKKYRNKNNDVNSSKQPLTNSKDELALLGHTDTDTDTDKNTCASNSDAQSGFDEFWLAYPKKKSKGTAERAWKKLKPNEQLRSEIMRGLGRAKTSDGWIRDGGKFIPYPATWLNARGWEDDLVQENKFEGAL